MESGNGIRKGMKNMGIFSYIFFMICSFILPVGVGAVLYTKSRNILPFLLGAACFFVLRICVYVPVIEYGFMENQEYTEFQIMHPFLYMIFLSFSEAVLVGIGRYLLMRICMKNSNFADGVSFGIAYGITETAYTVSYGIVLISIMIVYVLSSPMLNLFYTGAYMMARMIVNVGLSVLVWRTVSRRRFIGAIEAVFFHGGVTFAAMYAENAVSSVASFGVVTVSAIFMAGYILLIYKRVKKSGENLVSMIPA